MLSESLWHTSAALRTLGEFASKKRSARSNEKNLRKGSKMASPMWMAPVYDNLELAQQM